MRRDRNHSVQVYLNGQMIDETAARVSIHDAGFQHAVGLFETMGVYHGCVFRLGDHIDRLVDSARTLGLVRELDPEHFTKAVHQVIHHNHLDHARLRLTFTPGPISLLRGTARQPDRPDPTLLIVPSEPTAYDPSWFEKGVMVTIAPPAANPFDPVAGHKTLAYWSRLVTLRQGASVGAGETIWLNATNHLASGAVSNLFLVKAGNLFTPIARGEEEPGPPVALRAPVLPGVTRATVIQLAQSLTISIERRMLSIEDLLEADEVFLTNSSWHLLPVTRVEKKTIGSGEVGAVTQKLRTALLDLIAQETSESGESGVSL